MPLDPNIILAGLRNQDDGQSMIQAFQAGQGIAARRQQMQAQQMQMDEAQRQQMSQQAVDSALSHYAGQGGQIDREGVARYLGLRGEGRALQGLQQNWMQSDAAQAKAQREAAKAELENKIKQADFQARTAGAALAAYQRGDMQTPQALWQQSGMQGQFDPNMAFGMLRQGVEAKDMFSQEWDRQKFGEEMGFKKGEAESKRGMEEKKFAADQAESKQRLAQGWKGLSLQEAKMKFDQAKEEKAIKPQARKGNPEEVDNLLKQAEEILPESTGSFLGSGKELAARGFGMSTDAGKANQRLKAIEAAIMMNMPRMEGPQSDRDVALYRQMAGQIADTTLPRATRKAAIETIREIAQRQAGIKPQGGSSTSLPRVTDQASYDSVPVGGTYIDPDGNQRTKGRQ